MNHYDAEYPSPMNLGYLADTAPDYGCEFCSAGFWNEEEMHQHDRVCVSRAIYLAKNPSSDPEYAQYLGWCGSCHRWMRLKKDGTLRHHGGPIGSGDRGTTRAYLCPGAVGRPDPHG